MKQKVNAKKYPEHMVVSSLAHSRHISGLGGNSALIASLACLSVSISPCFLKSLIYYTTTEDKI